MVFVCPRYHTQNVVSIYKSETICGILFFVAVEQKPNFCKKMGKKGYIIVQLYIRRKGKNTFLDLIVDYLCVSVQFRYNTVMKLKNNYDGVIIGGGIIGCAILNKLVRLGKTVLLLEKGTDISVGSTKANSGVIHAGFDCKPGSLKAKTNVEGNRIYRKVWQKRYAGLIRLGGSIVVSPTREGLEPLFEKAKQNGVSAELWTKEQLEAFCPKLSPNLSFALYAPDSGICSPYELAVALAEEAEMNGAKIEREACLVKCETVGGEFPLNLSYHINGETVSVHTRFVVNAAGAGVNEVSKILGSRQFDLKFFRGEYLVLDKEVCPVSIPVFPLPSAHTKGCLILPTIHGNGLIGPTSYECDGTAETTPDGLDEVKRSAKNMLEQLPLNKTIRIFSGVRVLCGDDFIIEKDKSVDGVISLSGICSPGLTAAPAIAEMVACNLMGYKNIETDIIPWKPQVKMAELTLEQRNEIIRKNSDYGKIVCFCEQVSLGELKECLARPLAPVTADGVKRRLRPGMGRCQGGYCLQTVLNELAKAQKVPVTKIQKEEVGSYVVTP